MNTKKESYERTKKEGKISGQQEKVLEAVRNSNGLSREEISVICGIRLSAACGRVNELLKARKVRVEGRRWNPITKRNVEAIHANF